MFMCQQIARARHTSESNINVHRQLSTASAAPVAVCSQAAAQAMSSKAVVLGKPCHSSWAGTSPCCGGPQASQATSLQCVTLGCGLAATASAYSTFASDSASADRSGWVVLSCKEAAASAAAVAAHTSAAAGLLMLRTYGALHAHSPEPFVDSSTSLLCMLEPSFMLSIAHAVDTLPLSLLPSVSSRTIRQQGSIPGKGLTCWVAWLRASPRSLWQL